MFDGVLLPKFAALPLQRSENVRAGTLGSQAERGYDACAFDAQMGQK
jgi:hypothetical protein